MFIHLAHGESDETLQPNADGVYASGVPDDDMVISDDDMDISDGYDGDEDDDIGGYCELVQRKRSVDMDDDTCNNKRVKLSTVSLKNCNNVLDLLETSKDNSVDLVKGRNPLKSPRVYPSSFDFQSYGGDNIDVDLPIPS